MKETGDDIFNSSVIEHMDKWRKTHKDKFKSAETFWEMFFKELEEII